MNVAFHRAFDMTEAGAGTIAALVRAAGARITIMAGGGVRAHKAARLVARIGVREVHAGLETPVPSPMAYRNERLSMGAAGDREFLRFVASEENVRELVNALR